MIKIHHTVFASALLLSACSGNMKKPQDLSSIPTLEITATHAIEIDQSARGVSFVPNNVAPWLGRLILHNQDKSLSSTDIEGRATQKVSDLAHSQSFGLARENASGVFLAISDNLEAFIEADNQGNFTPLSYSGNTLTPQSFCETDTGLDDSASILTADGQIATVSLSIAKGDDAKSAPVEQNIASSLPAPQNTTMCAVTAGHTFAYSNSDDKAYLHASSDGKWEDVTAPTNVSGMVPLTLNDINYLLLVNQESIFLFNADTKTLQNKLVVNSGLSIGGLEKTKFIASTTHNYGGAAFSQGLVAFGQADEDRIVFVSRSYLEDLLKKEKS